MYFKQIVWTEMYASSVALLLMYLYLFTCSRSTYKRETRSRKKEHMEFIFCVRLGNITGISYVPHAG
jgi:hypothetical protein